MSRIAALETSAAAPKAQPLLTAVQKSLGMTPNLYRVAAQSPDALEGLLALTSALGRGRLDARTRESIALAVAQANGCDYCLSAHTVLGRGAGLSDADVQAARDGRASEARTALLLRFAGLLVAQRGQLPEGELDRLRQAGVTDGEVVEVVGNTVLNIFTNYLNLVAGTDIDFPVVRAGAARAA